MHDATRLIQTAGASTVGDRPTRTLNPAVARASTVLFDRYEDLLLANAGAYPGPTYGTDRLPLQRELEEAVRELEGGHLTRAFPSGIAAILNTLLAFTQTGDHILLCDNAYGPGAHFCQEILSRFGVKAGVAPASAGADIEPFIRALDEHARARVVLELPLSHPMSGLNDAWRHFWGVERPTRPSADDLMAVLAEMGVAANLEQFDAPPRHRLDVMVSRMATIRLCRPASREGEVAEFLAVHPPPDVRSLACVWWSPSP